MKAFGPQVKYDKRHFSEKHDFIEATEKKLAASSKAEKKTGCHRIDLSFCLKIVEE